MGLCDKSQESQVNTLIYAMGDEADDILGSLDLTDAQKLVYDTVQEAFQNHFIKRRNPIFERARFNQRKQEEGESVDSFITALYSLAKHCDYGALHDQMIRDRLVVGLRDAALSEKLQMDADLSLQTAISTARQRESVRRQQSVVRGDNQPNVDAVHDILTVRIMENFHGTEKHAFLSHFNIVTLHLVRQGAGQRYD